MVEGGVEEGRWSGGQRGVGVEGESRRKLCRKLSQQCHGEQQCMREIIRMPYRHRTSGNTNKGTEQTLTLTVTMLIRPIHVVPLRNIWPHCKHPVLLLHIFNKLGPICQKNHLYVSTHCVHRWWPIAIYSEYAEKFYRKHVQSVTYRGGVWGVQPPPPPEIPKFWQSWAEFPFPWKIHS
jgi:hypothetical protein